MDLNKLLDLGESYATYLVVGALAVMAGLIVQNLGGWFAPGAMRAIANLLLSPGRLLFLAGFVAAGVAGDAVPPPVRTACLIVGAVLLLHMIVTAAVPAFVGRAMPI